MKMGFREKEVERMTFYKWSCLFREYKLLHNFEKGAMYQTEPEEAEREIEVLAF